MKVTFLGATHEVTGSCTLLEVAGKYYLVDCGMEQGRDTFVNQEIPVPAGQIDFVLLTHAHIDHSGKLPLLCKNGFKGSIFATTETCNLCDIMLKDSAHIQEFEAEWRNRKGKRAGDSEYEPMYTMEDAEEAIRRLHPCSYGEMIEVSGEVSVRFTDVGHLLGSACIEVWLTEDGVTRKMLFSGDIGNTNQPIIRDPQPVEGADYVVIESTYGNRYHDKSGPHVETLAKVIQRTLDRGGNVVIPSFAIGRTQEMLYFIREIKERGLVKGHDGFPVYVDSPLANEATGIFLQTDTSCFDDETREVIAKGINPIMFNGLNVAVSSEESKAINTDKTPKVIISASGMCEAGRIRHHLKHNLWRPECTVLFVGYQAVGTLGRSLNDGAKTVKLFGEDIAVKAEIDVLAGKSGHADKQGLLDWINALSPKPKLVFVNHGETDSCEDFTKCLETEYGYKAFAPYSGTVFDLKDEKFLECPEGIPVEKNTTGQQRSNATYERLRSNGQRLMDAIKKAEGMPNKELARYASQIESIISKMTS